MNVNFILSRRFARLMVVLLGAVCMLPQGAAFADQSPYGPEIDQKAISDKPIPDTLGDAIAIFEKNMTRAKDGTFILTMNKTTRKSIDPEIVTNLEAALDNTNKEIKANKQGAASIKTGSAPAPTSSDKDCASQKATERYWWGEKVTEGLCKGTETAIALDQKQPQAANSEVTSQIGVQVNPVCWKSWSWPRYNVVCGSTYIMALEVWGKNQYSSDAYWGYFPPCSTSGYALWNVNNWWWAFDKTVRIKVYTNRYTVNFWITIPRDRYQNHSRMTMSIQSNTPYMGTNNTYWLNYY